MQLRVLNQQVHVGDQVVLLRMDADVPVKGRSVIESTYGRISKAAVTIEWLRQRGAKVVLLAHRGRPKGKRLPSLSLAPMAKRLSELLGVSIALSDQLTGPRVEKRIREMASGEILMIENVRYNAGERKDDKTLAKKWAQLGDVYINNAFASSHRKHASIHALAKLLPAYAGLQLQLEIQELDRVLDRAGQALFILGGAKIHTKIRLIESMLERGARFCIAGALAHPFFVAQGFSVGNSLLYEEDVPLARRLLKQYSQQIVLPDDVVVVRGLRKSAKQEVVRARSIGADHYSVDIGPEAIMRFKAEVDQAKMIVVNGPLGRMDIPGLEAGTQAVMEQIAKRPRRTFTLAGGGDTLALLDQLQLTHIFSHVSTGGGAMLAYLSGESLPGLEALTK